MSVRTSLFLLIAALLLTVLGVQHWQMQRQSTQLAAALNGTAYDVARDTLSNFFQQTAEDSDALWTQHDRVFDLSLVLESGEATLVLASEGRAQYIPVPRESVVRVLDDARRQQWLVSLVVGAFALGFAALLAHRFSRPLQQLQQATVRLAAGEFGTQVNAPARVTSEIRAALDAFNSMSAQLAELEASNKQLRAQQELNDIADLARGLAHSLRNPLHTLGLSLDELARSDLPAEQRDAFRAMARRQIQQIDQWLKALLSTTWGAHAQVESIELQTLAKQIADSFSDRHHDIQVISDEASLTLHGHISELSAMLHTLVANAVEACPNGPVRVQLARTRQGVHIQISDQGTGIDPAIQDKLFQPHVTTKTQGAGMGLFLARRIARARYHGDLTLQANTPHGTRAELELQHVR